MNSGEDSEKGIQIPSGQLIFAFFLVSAAVLGIIFVIMSGQNQAKNRADARARDLRLLKETLEAHPGFSGGGQIYPLTFSPDYRSYGEKKYSGWSDECSQPNNWIPGLAQYLDGKLPRDPQNSCRARIEREEYPRYQYISDGSDFKILSYKLSGEICNLEEFIDLIDPVRSCSADDASWAVYSPGAKKW
jgi:hypothetical protein